MLLYKKKTSARKLEIRRTPGVKLRFVGFRRFVSFNFGQVQLLRFIVVMVRSYSFGHVNNPISVSGFLEIFYLLNGFRVAKKVEKHWVSRL